MRFNFFYVVTASALCLGACASVKKSADGAVSSVKKALHIVEHTEVAIPVQEAPPLYKSAIIDLQKNEYGLALDALDEYLREEPTSPWTQAAILNSGRALEGLSRWSEAADRYRDVIAATNNAQRLQSMALYRLSFCNEALGQDTETVAALSDLLSRKMYLPQEIADAEMPARLASAYARVGNFDRAIEFYQTAEMGIVRLRAEASSRSGKKIPEWLPRTLYYMGNMSFRQATWEDFETAMRPLGRGQIYLLQASEFEFHPWSDRAAKELMKIYVGLWNVIQTAPLDVTGDPSIAQRARQKRQWELSALLLEALAELRARALPGPTAKLEPASRSIIEFSTDLEKQINKLLAERPAGEGLTQAARERRGEVRGHVVDPNSSLEEKFIESSRNIPKFSAVKPKPLDIAKKLPKKLTPDTPAAIAPDAVAPPAPAAGSDDPPKPSIKPIQTQDPNL